LDQRYGALTDQEALKKAVEEGGTRDPQRNAGYGLTGCVRIAAQNGGRFIVQSGGYRLTVDNRRRSNANPVFAYSRQLANQQGTIVELEIRTDRPVDLKRALRHEPLSLMESQHWSDTEFVIDVANEARDLGTREAGRLLRTTILNLARGEPEERFVLKFDGVMMVSSSFADECVAKVAYEVGRSEFFRHYELRGMNESVSAIVETTLWDRIG